MPELPDVEVFKRYIDATSLKKKIVRVEVPDSKVLVDCSAGELADAVRDNSLLGTRRWGKHLFAELDSGNWLALHFRMTSYPRYFKMPEGDEEDSRDARYDAVRFFFDNDYAFAFNSRRKLGRIQVIDDPDRFAEEHDLGPDALSLSEDQFAELAAGSRAGVKSMLMNQKLLSGIGNEYSDEILFQAKLHPEKKTNRLHEAGHRKLYRIMNEVLEEAINAKVDPEKMPDHFLTPNRQEGKPCPRCGSALEKITAAGRSAYICPSCQPEP
ncbi:Fpg/Nei family DNA glycosylase [Marinobacter sp.]|uniref:Fpg/Nei family DNA glycosylase n=1 Tax=Marinobacter sp. TaxID=50741 RepID=UPI00384EC35C